MSDGRAIEWEEPTCPGGGSCHGPLQWCSLCGDVDLICDFPECAEHPRIEAVRAEREACLNDVKRLECELRHAWNVLQEQEEKLHHYERGPYRMTSQTRKDLVREILDA